MPRFDLLAIDLDGTLFDSSRTISDENRIALSQAERAGVKVAVVTGRRLPAALPSLQVLDIDPVLVFNSGAIILNGFRGALLRSEMLALTVAKGVVALGRECGVEPIIHDGPNGEGHILMETSPTFNKSLSYYLERTKPPPRLVPDLMKAMHRDPVQVGFSSTVASIRLLSERIQKKFSEEVELALTEYRDRDFALLDVLSPNATKAAALRFLADHFEIPMDRTIAIGDNWNDLEMLETAGFAVVMSNAPEELRSRGFAMTGNNDEAGVAQAVSDYVLP
jgi:Cof subfamily protein (haloacid dehalogenase superfamily)